MAKDMKKDATDLSIEEKLKNLYQLQTMLSEIDNIRTLRGELPLEVQDLEDEIEGLSTRIEKIHGEIGELNADIATRKANIEASKASIEKYSQQLDNVRNNREYESLSKEIEYQTLDVELNEKRIREAYSAIEHKNGEIAHCTELMDDRRADLDVKKSELDDIISETRSEEEKLRESAKNLVCCWRSSVSVRTAVTDWVSFTCSAMLVVAVSIKSRPSVSWISACARRLSYANTAAVS